MIPQSMTPLIDYAAPLMKIEKLTKRISDMCLEGRLMEAEDLSFHLIAEVRVLQASLAIMENERKKRYDGTS